MIQAEYVGLNGGQQHARVGYHFVRVGQRSRFHNPFPDKLAPYEQAAAGLETNGTHQRRAVYPPSLRHAEMLRSVQGPRNRFVFEDYRIAQNKGLWPELGYGPASTDTPLL